MLPAPALVCGVADQVLIDLLAQHGFAPFGYDPFARRLVEPLQTHGNTVFVRGREAIEARCGGLGRRVTKADFCVSV